MVRSADPTGSKTILFVGILFLAWIPLSRADDDAESAYRRGVANLQLDDLVGAERELTNLVGGDGPVAALARFALANLRVRQAFQPGVSAGQAKQRLEEAVGLYRNVADGLAHPALALDDVRFNLELAKRLAAAVERGEPNSAPRVGAPAGKSEADAAPVPGAAPPKDAPAGTQKSQLDVGAVRDPSAGLPFSDPGRLDPAAARALLRSTQSRLRESRPALMEPRPRMSGDY